jgi:hypothetical protein
MQSMKRFSFLFPMVVCICLAMGCTKRSPSSIDNHIATTLEKINSPALKKELSADVLSRLTWECRSAKILSDQSKIARNSGRLAVAVELERRAREMITPSMKVLALSGKPGSEGSALAGSEKELSKLSDAKYPAAVAAVTLQAMATVAADKASISNLAEEIKALPLIYGEPVTDAREIKLFGASDPLDELVEFYPELVRSTLEKFYSNGLGYNPSQKDVDKFVYFQFVMMLSPELVANLGTMSWSKYGMSLKYDPPFDSIPEAKDQVKTLPALRDLFRRRWAFYSQLTNREVCDYVTSLWSEEGKPFRGELLRAAAQNVRQLSSADIEASGKLCAGEREI